MLSHRQQYKTKQLKTHNKALQLGQSSAVLALCCHFASLHYRTKQSPLRPAG